MGDFEEVHGDVFDVASFIPDLHYVGRLGCLSLFCQTCALRSALKNFDVGVSFGFGAFPNDCHGCRSISTSACLSVLELSQTIATILTSACLSVLELSRMIAMDAEAF